MKILIIDDDSGTCETLSIGLRRIGGHMVSTAMTGGAGLAMADATAYDTVLVDLMLPDVSGLDVLRGLPATKTAGALKYLMTGHGSIVSAVEAMKLGAADYLPKPFDIDVVLRVFGSEEAAPADRAGMTPDRRITAVLAMIAQQPTISVTELAATVGLSESRLQHLFSEVVGMSLGHFQLGARLDKAAELLLSSHRRVSEIGYGTGFADAGHFIRCFAARFGVSPSAFRRSNAQRGCGSRP
jgi:YesN/AraC family two-component response regulator